MSVVSRVRAAVRPLRDDERALVVAMLGNAAGKPLAVDLNQVRVAEMQDGGMGSLEFVEPPTNRQFGDEIAEARFTDSDGVLVSVTINVDTEGRLFELDIWKVDNTPLLSFPRLA